MPEIAVTSGYCSLPSYYNLEKQTCEDEALPSPASSTKADENASSRNSFINWFKEYLDRKNTNLPLSFTGCGDNLHSPADAQVENHDATECQPNGSPRESLTFTFQNWSEDEIAKLNSRLQKLTPIMEQYYGKPLFGNQIVIDKADWCELPHYVPCTNKINFCTSSLIFTIPDTQTLSHEVAHAYHDELTGVSNEEGFANLLAFYTAYQYWYSYGPDEINFSLHPAMFYSYVFGVYDLNNQKAGAMPPPCYIEDQLGINLDKFLQFFIKYQQSFIALAKINATSPNFMPDFNNVLYQAQIVPYSGQELLEFLSNWILPPNHTIEGNPLSDWYKAQYALSEITDAGYKILALFTYHILQLWDSIYLDGISIWEDRFASKPTSDCKSGILERSVFSGTANIRVEDFQGVAVYSSSIEIKDGITQNNPITINIPPNTVTSQQRIRMVISVTTPEGTTEERGFYLPFCSGNAALCRPDISIQGIINGLPPEESLSGNIDVEIDAYRWNTGELTNIKQSAPYALGYFIFDLSDYPSLIDAEKSFVRFTVKSNLGDQSSFSAERIWLAPYLQAPFFVSLNAN